MSDPSAAEGSLERLPLITLYLTERCNSRCISCDYWRHGRADLDLAAVARLVPSLARLKTEVVVLSGGEPLLNPEWREIAGLLRAHGMAVWLLTSGLALAKWARRAVGKLDAITVSLDGANAATYEAIRGLDAFDIVCAGVRAAAVAGLAPTLRVTLQRRNFRELTDFIELARSTKAAGVSFLAVDVGNPHAFGHRRELSADLALASNELPEFRSLLDAAEERYAAEFRSGFIRESPAKLRRIAEHFSAQCGLGPFPQVRCNAPEFSAVMGANGRVQPCFFIPGPRDARVDADLDRALDAPAMRALRKDIRERRRPECLTCVCSMWRDPAVLETGLRASLLPMTSDARAASR